MVVLRGQFDWIKMRVNRKKCVGIVLLAAVLVAQSGLIHLSHNHGPVAGHGHAHSYHHHGECGHRDTEQAETASAAVITRAGPNDTHDVCFACQLLASHFSVLSKSRHFEPHLARGPSSCGSTGHSLAKTLRPFDSRGPPVLS